MPGNHSVCKVHAVFLIIEAKEAVEVIKASDVIMSDYMLSRSLRPVMLYHV